MINPESSGFTVVGSELIVSSPIFDYESNDHVTVIISVSDNGTPIRTTIVSIDVAVIDVNEAPSAIQLDSLEFYEDVGLGDVIAELKVIDPDNAARPTQKHTCRIAERHPSTEVPFRIEYQKNRHILVLASLTVDFERMQRYSMSIVCADDGAPPMKLRSSFGIRVMNRNEAPTKVLRSFFYSGFFLCFCWSQRSLEAHSFVRRELSEGAFSE